MAWQDRLQTAAYTSPGGVRTEFSYESVSVVFTKKTSAFDSPDVDGTYIQDNGRTGRRLPLRIFIHGDNYDIDAEAFLASLAETGEGVLEHPNYGNINVVPFGEITRQDGLQSDAGQAIFEIVFWETTGVLYPSLEGDPSNAVTNAVGDFNDGMAEEFAESVDLGTETERVTFLNRYQTALNATRSGLNDVASVQRDVERQFSKIGDSIDRSLDILVEDPLSLARQTIQLLETPSISTARIASRLTSYGQLIGLFTENDVETPNQLYSASLYASTCVAASILSTTATTFETRSDALSAAEVLETQFDTVNEWREENYVNAGETDTGQSYAPLQEALAIAQGFLVEISFTLKQEFKETLTTKRALLDYVAEKYGELSDDTINFFINSNNLTGDEILTLPKGRTVVYYV